MVYTEFVYIFSVVGRLFTKTSQNVVFQRNTVRHHFLMQFFSSICAHRPHLEYSGGYSVTSARIHVITCDGELDGDGV